MIVQLESLHGADAMVVYLPGKTVGFRRGGEGVDEADPSLQLTNSTLVNCIEDRIFFCDGGLLSIPCGDLLMLSSWNLVV